MTNVKTYGWLSVEKLRYINKHPKIVSMLYDLGLLPEEISARVRGYVDAETERCAKIAENFPTSENTNIPKGIAQEIRRPLHKSQGGRRT